MKTMTQQFRSIVFAIAIALCMIPTSILGDDLDTLPDSGYSIETHWSALLSGEPESSRAILQLAKMPSEATAFMAERLQPLSLTSDRLQSLLIDLQSSDDQVWQSAFRELEYFDPRLASGLEELLELDSMKHSPARNRLVTVLSGGTSKRVSAYKFIQLRRVGENGYNFYGSDSLDAGGASWWAEHKVERLNNEYGNPKSEWSRIVRSIVLLESFGTPESMAIIKKLSEGHPDAQPTKVALDALARADKAEQ